ncbi:MAG: potassium transporter TrkG [Candidatus Rifleibacteriota bacterium]
MKFVSIRRNASQQPGLDGLLLVIAAISPVFAGLTNLTADYWLTFSVFASVVLFVIAGFSIFRYPLAGKISATLGAVSSLAALFPLIREKPMAALAAGVVFIFGLDSLADFQIKGNFSRAGDDIERILQRARYASIALAILSVSVFFLRPESGFSAEAALIAAAILAQIMAVQWSVAQSSNFHKLAGIVINSITACLLAYFYSIGIVWVGALNIASVILILLPSSSSDIENASNWWEPMINHPGRVMTATFFILCVCGTFLLALPGATEKPVSLLDAAFTSVSAVCVTGLIVLDTPNDFSLLGQFFILLLIQLGGLGIMTITTVALYALGRRLSLRQERILNSAYNADHQSLSESLSLIVKFTFAVEFLGMIILTTLFYGCGLDFRSAFWKGIFTSISAFCNAGFALQSDSLIPFQDRPLILHTVALLIIVGGIAPAVNLSIPSWIRGKSTSVANRIVLVTTVVLLLTGTVFFLAFEWNNSLAGLSLADKFHNAWFQSVTLRTAGFNSVAIENVLGPTFLMMICLMFIGGCPGGTAGGVKTATIGVLGVTFWSCAIGNDDISLQNRRILPETVFKSVTIVASGFFLLLLVILMLEATQIVGARELIFEAASALGTVGLSLGATLKLDSIGKIIIMFAMFAGRIGPITLFTMLSHERPRSAQNLLEARINLS